MSWRTHLRPASQHPSDSARTTRARLRSEHTVPSGHPRIVAISDVERSPAKKSATTRSWTIRQCAHDRPERDHIGRGARRVCLRPAAAFEISTLDSSATQPRSAGVHENSMAPRARPFQPSDSAPMDERLDHRVLDKVLAIPTITGHCGCDRHQSRIFGAVQVLEPQPDRYQLHRRRLKHYHCTVVHRSTHA